MVTIHLFCLRIESGQDLRDTSNITTTQIYDKRRRSVRELLEQVADLRTIGQCSVDRATAVTTSLLLASTTRARANPRTARHLR